MLKKRIIFSLLYKDGFFCLSRNFRLQEIGDIDWLLNSYNFEEVSGSIDELAIFNIGSSTFDKTVFFRDIERITRKFFIPITIGGKVRRIEDARRLFESGADKISLNTLYETNEEIAASIAGQYGSQAIVASIDYKKNIINNKKVFLYYLNESQKLNEDLTLQIKKVQKLGCGEILLRSIDADGTGNGLDLDFLEVISVNDITVPLIVAGGIGKSEHMIYGLENTRIDAVCTANLLNFVNKGLMRARQDIAAQGLPISKTTY